MTEIVDEYGGTLLAAVSLLSLLSFFGCVLLGDGSILHRLIAFVVGLYL